MTAAAAAARINKGSGRKVTAFTWKPFNDTVKIIRSTLNHFQHPYIHIFGMKLVILVLVSLPVLYVHYSCQKFEVCAALTSHGDVVMVMV